MDNPRGLPVFHCAGVIIDAGDVWYAQLRDNIDNIAWPGKVAVWGGAMEVVDESSAERNALRELNEETGLNPEDVELTCFGTYTTEHTKPDGRLVWQETKLFVAKLKKPTFFHVYEGKAAYPIDPKTPLDQLDIRNFSPGLPEAIEMLKAYYER